MPTYIFKHTQTGEIWEEFISFTRRQEILEDPDIEPVVTAPAVISGISGHTHKTDSGFNDVLSRIAQANPHSPMADVHGSKGITETKVRHAVDKAKRNMPA